MSAQSEIVELKETISETKIDVEVPGMGQDDGLTQDVPNMLPSDEATNEPRHEGDLEDPGAIIIADFEDE